MKAKLLRKIRKLHPIYFDIVTKNYTYIPINCDYGNNHEYENSKNYKDLLKNRRMRILSDANVYFFTSLFCYKRKRIYKFN